MTTPKDHYVPKFYLDGFVDPATDKLWVVDLKTASIRPDAPINAARISGYDNLQGNTITIKERSVASKALKAIETRAAPVIAKLRNQIFLLTFEGKDDLSNFIGQQISRVPVFRNFINARMDEVPNEIIREKVLSKKFETKYGKNAIKMREMALSGNYPVRFKFKEPFDRQDGVILSSIMLGRKFSSLLFGMNWIFLVSRDSGLFFTSDNPARLSFLTSGSATIDFNKPNTNIEISFPISPSCTLLAHYHNESHYRHRFTFVDPLTVDEFNSGVFRTANRYIYCSKQEQGNQILNQTGRVPF
jgi:hypothetical protein